MCPSPILHFSVFTSAHTNISRLQIWGHMSITVPWVQTVHLTNSTPPGTGLRHKLCRSSITLQYLCVHQSGGHHNTLVPNYVCTINLLCQPSSVMEFLIMMGVHLSVYTHENTQTCFQQQHSIPDDNSNASSKRQ